MTSIISYKEATHDDIEDILLLERKLFQGKEGYKQERREGYEKFLDLGGMLDLQYVDGMLNAILAAIHVSNLNSSILDLPEDIGSRKDLFEQALNKFIDFKKIDFWFSKPTRFGNKYRDEVKNAKNISCYINSNVTDIILSENLSRVNEIKIQNYTGKSFMANVETFILASGGIENPRIMLNCNHQIKDGLGNSTGLVGRFFTEQRKSFWSISGWSL